MNSIPQSPEPNQSQPAEPKSKKGLVIGVVVGIIAISVIAALLIVFLRPKPTTPPSNETALTSLPDAEISITENGFEPASVTIKKNQQVTWINRDTKQHRVASDPHPTHDMLPGLDSQAVLLKDDSYSFSFEKSGTYTYHDHLDPVKFHGTVVVKD